MQIWHSSQHCVSAAAQTSGTKHSAGTVMTIWLGYLYVVWSIWSIKFMAISKWKLNNSIVIQVSKIPQAL